MACCGAKRTQSDYLITYKDGSTETVTQEQGGLPTVRVRLAQSPQGGTYKMVPKAK